MPALSKDQLLSKIKERIGEDTSDEALRFIEDVTDTIDDYESKTKDNTDWKKKYEDNDAEWRKKYKERFFNTPAKDEPEKPPEGSDNKPKTYEYKDLFKEESK